MNNRDGFELCKEIEQDVFLSCLELSVGQRKKIWVPMRNWTSDLPIPHANALPLSHRDSTVSEVYHKVHVWHGSCLLMGNQKQKAGGLTPHGTHIFFFASCSRQNEKITFSNNLQSSSSNISFWKFRGYIGIAQWQIGRLLLWLKSNDDLINCKMCSFINYQQQVLFPDLDILLVTLCTECWVS